MIQNNSFDYLKLKLTVYLESDYQNLQKLINGLGSKISSY